MGYSISRTHEVHVGHRVYGHEGKCRNLHGHGYVFTFTCIADQLDAVGRVVDFSVVKATLCQWLEENWDHRTIIWDRDPILPLLQAADPTVVAVPFNPTAENIAEHMVRNVAPGLLSGSGVRLSSCRVQETIKCSAVFDE